MAIPAFQFNAFQHNSFQEQSPQSLILTDVINKLKLPVNCVVIGDQPEEGALLSDWSRRLIFRE